MGLLLKAKVFSSFLDSALAPAEPTNGYSTFFELIVFKFRVFSVEKGTAHSGVSKSTDDETEQESSIPFCLL